MSGTFVNQRPPSAGTRPSAAPPGPSNPPPQCQSISYGGRLPAGDPARILLSPLLRQDGIGGRRMICIPCLMAGGF